MGCSVSKDVKVEDQRNCNAIDEARAASKIQASFRGYKVRKELKTMKTEETKPHVKEEIFEIDSNDTDLTKAVTKIQASFRGFKARKYLKTHEKGNKVPGWTQEQSINEMDLSDPNLLKAATKIQATFRGYHVRKGVCGLNVGGE
ncbi:abnormal spindle-like microcephaly-associated protein homolog [Limulus polyphemus]|uniref:Abnormal spindle-like microcephaly-associated protein homolog n=1 Tax=Limulus polyphemus TaxID=6850 RepID=A0ABM1S7Z2_LIMPO|nr:abnormal spindle-like microcephaly-associated protein homolog [Limulus polyphemus]